MNWIYTLLKYFNDIRAVKNGRIGKRISWRIEGKISNRFLNKWFK